MKNKYKAGVDTATTGSIAIVDGNKIIDVIKYPDRVYDKGQEKIIKAKIKYLETQERSVTKIKNLKAELKALKRRADRDYKSLYGFLKKYRNKLDYICVEEPIRQSVLGTSIDAIFANAMTLAVYLTICSILDLKVILVRPQDWHKQYVYSGKGSNTKEKREFIKQESIEFCRENFENADEFILYGKKKVPDDNIAEATLIALYNIGEE